MYRSLGFFLSAGLLLGGLPGAAFAGKSPAPSDARIYIIAPEDGAAVTSPFTVRFGLSGMGVAPAGIDAPSTGHHHLLINVDTPPELDDPLPSTDQVRHFGGGQTETVLDLPPGEHTLQLILGDHRHVPHDPPLISDKVRITVTQ